MHAATSRRWFARAGDWAATVALASGLLLPTLAVAREDYCLRPGTQQIDQQATAAFRQLEAQSNQAIMNRLAGVWLATVQSPATGQVSYLYEQFGANGLYGYTNYVCSANGFCSRYDGTGVYAVRANGPQSFLGSKDVSDTVGRDHACLSLTATFRGRNTLVAPGGQVSRRVQ